MSLFTKVSEDLKTAMKEKNPVKLGVLRVLKAELQRAEQSTNGKVELVDGDVIKVAKKMIDGIKETTNNQEELLVLDGYLPKQLSEETIRMIVATVKKSGISQMGDFMKFFKTNHDGQYDGKLLSQIVKETLS